LTDQTGAAMPAGAYAIQFRLWDDPLASGTNDLIWGQQQNLTVQPNGVFNAILGSPGGSSIVGATSAVNNLTYAFAGTNCFLGLTVISNPSGVLTNLSEILPRQQLLSVPFAVQAQNAMVASSVTPASIVNASLTPGLVTLTNLAPRQIGTNVGVGGIAVSLPSGTQQYDGTAFQNISNMSVTIQTTGRPVLAFLGPPGTNTISTPYATPSSYMMFNMNTIGQDYFILQLVRDSGQPDQAVIASQIGTGSGSQAAVGYPTPFMVTDFLPPPGQHTYQLQWGTPVSGTGYLLIQNTPVS